MANYTRSVEEEYLGYEDQVLYDTRTKIENMNARATNSDWREVIKRIATENTCSARFFLMRYLYEDTFHVEKKEYGFDYSYGNNVYHFNEITPEHAFNLPEEERNKYIELLCRIAETNHDDPTTDGIFKPLMWKAMLRNRTIERISRDEAFMIAHGLHFDMQQTEQFLLRALDNDGFNLTRSDDLIEAFCFLYSPANHVNTAKRLKKQFQDASASIPKVSLSEKEDGFTTAISLSLSRRIEEWERDLTKDVEEQFMEWILSHAPSLDVPSKSAYVIYQKLAFLAYELVLNLTTKDENLDIPYLQENDFIDTINARCFSDEEIEDYPDINKLTNDILRYAMNEFDNIRKRSSDQIWRYLIVDENGRVTATAVGERIQSILLGYETVSKADLLFLLWFVCDIFWSENEEELSIYDCVSGFWTLADDLLDASNLPEFYAPHLLEGSFLTSICKSTDIGDTPFEIYEGLCEFVLPEKRTRIREKKADEKKTKASRAILEKNTEDLFISGQLNFAGIEETLKKHFSSHFVEKCQYLFAPEGVYYLEPGRTVKDPTQKTIILYEMNIGYLFDQTRNDYKQEDIMTKRFQFLYGLKLYLKDHAAPDGYSIDFRVNYQVNATLSLIKAEKN